MAGCRSYVGLYALRGNPDESRQKQARNVLEQAAASGQFMTVSLPRGAPRRGSANESARFEEGFLPYSMMYSVEYRTITPRSRCAPPRRARRLFQDA